LLLVKMAFTYLLFDTLFVPVLVVRSVKLTVSDICFLYSCQRFFLLFVFQCGGELRGVLI
jgi:hypothetical protein